MEEPLDVADRILVMHEGEAKASSTAGPRPAEWGRSPRARRRAPVPTSAAVPSMATAGSKTPSSPSIHTTCTAREVVPASGLSALDARSTDRISDLERSLGRLLGPATRRSQTGSGASETPISIVPDVAVSAKGSGPSVDGTVRIGLKDDAVAQEVDVSISLRAIGEGDFRMDRIRVHVTGHDGVVWREGEARGRMALTPGQAVVLTVASAVYDRNWRVEFLPSVEPVPASGASS